MVCGAASWLVEAALQLSGVQSISLACVSLIAGSGLFVYAALRHFRGKRVIGGGISAAIVAITGCAIWYLVAHSTNGAGNITNTTGPINANSGIIAPGATGAINQYNNVPPPLPNSEIEQIKQLDVIFAGRDENDLRILFGYQEMVSLNIEINKQRRLQYQKTGGTYFDYEPYRQGREMQVDWSWAPKNLVKNEYGAQLILDINVVSLLVLPTEYSVNKKRLLQFENSSFLPVEVIADVKEFDRALEDNTNSLMKVLNVAMREDPNYFLKHDEFNTRYFGVIQSRYFTQFIQLRSIADKIRDSTRAALRSNDVTR